jgi:CheY-like chemotaxis protein
VLIVDDDDDFRAIARRTLEQAGTNVVEARNGDEALAYLLNPTAIEPRCVVLDLEMPGVSGWELLRIMRAYLRLGRIPVIVLSAHAPTIVPPGGPPPDIWLQKPQTWETIIGAIGARSTPYD